MAVDLAVVWEGLTNALTFYNLLWLVIGVTLGLISGTLPGLGGGTMMAILLPIATTLPVDTMLITLAAIYAANVYADSTTGILYNIPGGAAGIPATVEGHQLKLRGRLQEAFAAQVSGSFFGAFVGFVVLLLLVPTFIIFVKIFGSAERALLATWALVFICSGAITREDPLPSFLSVGVGLALALIGQQPNIGTFRFTLGLTGLWDGLAVVLVVMGLFAVPQLLEMSKVKGALQRSEGDTQRIAFFSLYRSMGNVLASSLNVVTRSSLFGVFIGIIPGIGTSTAAWVGYSVARKHTKQPEKFGTGNRDGVLGAESASNACEVGTIIPLLSLGIPGSAAAAIMLAALNLVGINPGPSMYASHGAQVWTVMFGIGLSGLAFSILAYPFIKGGESLSRLPVSMLIGAIGTLCVMGAFLETHNIFGPLVMVILGTAMIFGTSLGLKVAPLLIGFVLGPGIEKELIRAYQIGGFERFTAPASMVLIAIIVGTLALSIYNNRRQPEPEAQAGTGSAELDTAIAEAQGAANRAPIKEIILSSLGLAFAAYLLFETLSYPLFASLWVYFVALCFIAVPSAIILYRGIRNLRGEPQAGGVWDSLKISREAAIGPAVIIAAFVAFILLIPFLGFLISTALFCAGVTLFLDRSPLKALIVGISVPVLIWVVKYAFSFYLPRGPFGF